MSLFQNQTAGRRNRRIANQLDILDQFENKTAVAGMQRCCN
jgi:hypothetical protein